MPGSINSVLLKSTAVAALGGLLFGFDTAVISGTTSALRSVFQLTPNVLGIPVAYLSNYILGRLRLGQAEWRWDLGVAAIPAALFFMFLAGIPRSPRWLAKVQRLEEARSVLAQIGEPDPDAELADIVRS